MYIAAKLVLKSYMPERLRKGMYFLTNIGKTLQVIQLDHTPIDEELFLQENGYPVDMYIVDEGNPNIANDTTILAQPHQIGWFDYDDLSDEYRDIQLREINMIIDDFSGNCNILMEEKELDEDNIYIIPFIYNDKVVISFADFEELDNEDDDYNDYLLEGDESYNNQNNEEDD